MQEEENVFGVRFNKTKCPCVRVIKILKDHLKAIEKGP